MDEQPYILDFQTGDVVNAILKKAQQLPDRTHLDAQLAAKTSFSDVESAVTTAINALDASQVGGAGKYIASIQETNGIVSAVAGAISSEPASEDPAPVSSGGVYSALAGKQESIADLSDIRTGAEAGATAVQTIQINGIAQTKAAGVVNLPAYPANASDVGALPSSTKYAASIVLSIDSSTYVVTAQLKDQDGNNLGSSQTVDLPLETMVVGGSYDSASEKIILTLKNGQTVEFSVAALVSGLQTEITAQNKLDADLVDDSTSTNKFVTAAEKSTWTAKQDALTFDGTYNASTNKAATVSTVTNAINDLDVSAVGGSGKYISEIAETDGKIVPVEGTIDSVPTALSQNPVSSGGVQAPLAELINSGAKNFLKLGFTAKTSGTVTGTMTADGNGIVVNGNRTQTSDTILIYDVVTDASTSYDTRYTLPAGKYVLNAARANVQVQVYAHDGTAASLEKLAQSATIASEFEYTAEKKQEKPYLCVRVWIGRSHNYESETIYPMICTKAEWDISQQFEPYALSNPVITPAMIEQVDEGSKNKLKNSAITQTVGEVVYTVNPDGTVSAYTTATTTASRTLTLTLTDDNCYVNAGDLITGNPDTTLDVAMQYGIGSSGNIANYVPSEEYHVITVSGYVRYCLISIRSGVSIPQASPLIFKPMICTRAAWDISHEYVPYGKTNAELTTLEQQDRDGLLPVINKGSKNLLYSYKDTAISTDDITVTYNTNGSYTFECIDVAENRIISLGQIGSVKSDTYTISGSTGGSSTTYMLGLYNTSASAVKYQHTNLSEDYAGDVSGFTLRVRVIAGYSGTFTVYPMICTKGEYQIDPTFSEYRKDNEQLTTDTDYLINIGVKNLLHFDAIGSGVSVYGNKYTHNGITYTLNADMTVTATGTADSDNNSYAYLILNSSFAPIDDYCDGKHIVSGCPSNGSTSKYRMYIVKSGWGSLNETGRGAIIPDKGNYTGFLIACFVSKGYAIPAGEPLVFKPMIRSAAITDPTFQPYSLSNPVLTPALIEQVDEGAKNLCNVEDYPTTTAVWRQTTLGDGVTLPAGEYILSFTNITSDADGTLMQIIFAKDISFAEITSDYYHITKGTNTSRKFRLTGDTSAIRIYAGSSYASSQGKSLSFSGFMICSVEGYAVSPKFVPYCPTNRELYESDKVIDISNAITAETGYTVESTTHLYYQNKKVFGTIAIAINSGSYSSSITAIAKLPVEYAPARQHLGSCGFSTDQWAITDIGYAFIQAANASSTTQRGQISVKSPTANLTHMILNVCYPVQIDEVLSQT